MNRKLYLSIFIIMFQISVVGMCTAYTNPTEIFRDVGAEGWSFHFINDLSVSPDGTKIIFTAGTSKHRSDGCINSNKICLLDPSQKSYYFDAHTIIPSGSNPEWSPDGTKIVYLNTDENCWTFSDPTTGEHTYYNTNIYIIDENGEINKIVDTNQDKYRPTWSPDGKKIAYFATSFGTDYIYIIDADGTNITKLTPGRNPKWSPDGKLIAYEHEDHVYVVGSDANNKTELYDEPAKGAIWSPDGKKIAFSSGEIIIVDISGDNIINTGVEGKAEAWFSDGKNLLFSPSGLPISSSGYIGIVNTDGSDMRTLVKTNTTYPNVALSPDDDILYYTDTEMTQSELWATINKIDITHI